MVVVLEARLDKLEKGFQKARQAANSNFNAISTDAAKMEATLARVGSGGGFDRLARSTGALKVQTGNLAAQFNDIGVQLAGGQSPLLIALQQGTQITQALGPMGAGAAVKALGSAFLSLLNPLSLLTIGIISLGGIAVQKLTEWYSSGEMTEKQLEEQANLIRQVAKEWGNAVPELQKYVAELDKTLEKQRLLAAANALAAKEFAPLGDAVRDISAGVAAVGADMQSLGAEQGQIDGLRAAFAALEQAVAENSNSSDEYRALQDQVAAVLNGNTSPAIEALTALLNANAAAFANAAANAGKLQEQAKIAANLELGPLGTLTPLESGGGKFLNPAEAQDFRANNTKSQFQIAADRGGSKRDAAAEAAKREAQAVAELIAQLEFELSLLGMTEVEKEKANALRRAGSAATDEQRAKIVALTEQIYLQEQAQKAAKTAAEEQKRAMEELGQIGTDALNGIASALQDGKISGEELIQIVGRLIEQLLSMQNLGGIFPSLFGGGFGPNWTGATGPWGKAPGFAGGTNYAPGGMAWVGERGPELVNLPRGSQVIPSSESLAMARGGGRAPSVSIVNHVDARGADQAAITRLERGLAKTNAEIEVRVVKTLRDNKNGKWKV